MPKIENDDPRRCQECKAFISHSPDCSLIDLESAKSLLKQYYNIYKTINTQRDEKVKHAWDITARYREQMQKWEGKYLVVKNENNQLRKKIKGKE